MRRLTHEVINGLVVGVLALGLVPGCTTYNPTTGQNEIDYGATAGVAGAALGAAALGVALSNNDDDERYYYGGPGYHGGGAYYGGSRGHNTVNVDRNMNVNRNVNVNNQKANVSNRKVNTVNRTNKSARINTGNRVNKPQSRPTPAHRGGGSPRRHK